MIRANAHSMIVLMFAAMLAFAGIVGLSYRGQAASKTVWEYKVVRTTANPLPANLGDPEHFLNELGTEGWEFVQFIRTDQMGDFRGSWILKRAK